MVSDTKYKELEERYYRLRSAYSAVLERISNGRITEPCVDTAYVLSLLYGKDYLDNDLR